MKAAGCCIVIVIVLLVLAGTAAVIVPVLGKNPPWEQLPYEGSALDFYGENAELLNPAAELLWAHPEFFDQRRIQGEYDSLLWAGEMLGAGADHSMFTDEEWATIRQLSDTTEIFGLYYYYGSPPMLEFILNASQPPESLLYIRTQGYTSGQISLALQYYGQIYDRLEATAYPHWYVGYQED